MANSILESMYGIAYNVLLVPISVVITTALAGLWLLPKLNDYLNARALNSTEDPTWDWTKEIVLITGGSGGIGEPVVQRFAARGITTVVLDITPPRFKDDHVHFYECDVTSPTAVEAVSRSIKRDVGPPTVLMNNAGIGLGMSTLSTPPAKLQQIFTLNIMCHWYLVQAFLPDMIRRQHGHIVTMASMASFIGVAQDVAYCATKAAALAFHEGLGQEMVHRYQTPQIRTSIIHPSWVRTPMTATLNLPSYITMSADYVADEIVAHILRAQSGQLILPKGLFWQFITSVKGWPNWMQQRVRANADRAVPLKKEGVVGEE